ncbi:cytosine permease [Neobacillus niacini]|uniref:purine-cytosine permease family protein n=1 Tax=Neobacillus niacini TaxID=86668 RepID=UPI003002F255
METEKRSIDFIPESERHGKPRNLFNIWFCCQGTFLSLVTGCFAIQMGLNVFWGLIAIILGHMVGGIFMASHSAQGPKLGIPQMIQSRAQFGVVGAAIPIIFVIFLYIFYFAASGILGGQSLHAAFPSLSVNWWIIILSIIALVINIFGHDWIHTLNKYLTIFTGIIFVIATILVLMMGLPEGSWSPANFAFKPFLFIFSMTAAWQLTTAPYVADYSRYLPSNTPASKTFWFTYAGSVGGAIWMMTLGLFLAAAIPNFLDTSSESFANLFFPGLRPIIYVAIALGIVGLNVLNLYGAFMSTTTVVASMKDYRGLSMKMRVSILIIVTSVSTFLGTWGQSKFLIVYPDVMLILIYILLPWSAINLVDYYFLRKGNYSVPDIFNRNGIYGKFNGITLIVYALALLAELPFMYLSFFHGNVANMLEGADITWVVGSLVPGLLYYFLMKNKQKVKQNTNLIGKVTT